MERKVSDGGGWLAPVILFLEVSHICLPNWRLHGIQHQLKDKGSDCIVADRQTLTNRQTEIVLFIDKLYYMSETPDCKEV